MCGFQDAMCNIMPTDWFDPYGRTPFAKDAELSVDITIVETDDGIRAKSVKNPPTSGSSRIMDAIKNALGMGFDICDPLCSSPQADDLGKCEDTINNNKKDESQDSDIKSQDSDIMKPSSSGDSKKQGSQPWSSEKSSEEPSRHGATQEKDAKEKAPRFK